MTAIGVLHMAAEAKMRIPEDISVIGFDDIQLSAFTQPPLTTVSLPRGEIAKAAFHALLHAREKGSNKPLMGKKYVVQPSMVLRSSTAPAPRKPA
jgi:LacI family transcriptional regulator